MKVSDGVRKVSYGIRIVLDCFKNDSDMCQTVSRRCQMVLGKL